MRSRTRVLGIIFFALLALIAVLITVTIGWRPIIGPMKREITARHFDSTPARLARGKYLVDSVTGCFGCHSPADLKKRGTPPLEDKLGAGMVWPDPQLPWLVAPNITPDKETGAGNWSDDVFARAIREGIGHDGRALFPLMPYPQFRSMSDEDLASVIVYVRSVPPVRNELPKTKLPFPLKFLVNNSPEPLQQPVPPPDSSSAIARGAYLVKLGACADCHTPQDRGKPVEGMDFAGGMILDGPTGRVASANITPDASGISYYDENLFVHTLRQGKVGARELNPVMPWWFYGQMTDDDLKSVFAFLRTLKPVHHRVDNVEVATECKVCRQKHGLGDQN